MPFVSPVKPLRSSGYGGKQIKKKQSLKTLEHLSMESIQGVYQPQSLHMKKKAISKPSTNPSDPHLFSKDAETLQMELNQSKQVIGSLQKEKRSLSIKVRGLEEALAKVEQSQKSTPYNPYDKSQSLTKSLSVPQQLSINSTSTLHRQYEALLKTKEDDLEQIKKCLRFTKMVELENELKIYYQEMCRMKNSYEDQGNIHVLFEQLSKYKNAVKEVLNRAQKLSDRELQLKTVHHDLMQERNSLKKTVLDLKNQIKSQSKVNEEIHQLHCELEDAKKREKEHELEKVRMNAANAKERQDLESTIAYLKGQLEATGVHVKMERRRSSVVPHSVKNRKHLDVNHDNGGSSGDLKKNLSRSLKELDETESPFSRPSSAFG